MIVYLDSSALVKLLVVETDSDSVLAAVSAASIVASSRIAYAEAMAAIARRHREGKTDESTRDSLVARLDGFWNDIVVLEVDEREAGRLSLLHPLRGADAIHVAAALTLRTSVAPTPVWFIAFDQRLNAAASSEGLSIQP